MKAWHAWLGLGRNPIVGQVRRPADQAGRSYPNHRHLDRAVSRGYPTLPDRSGDEAGRGGWMIDRDCLERFRQQVSQHRRYGWDIYEYSEIPPVAVLAPCQPSRAVPAPSQPPRIDLLGRISHAGDTYRHRSWCCVWVDEGGEVRWQSVAAPPDEIQ